MLKLIDSAVKDIQSIPTAFSTYVVGMSGGVDSSVSAFLLKEAGFNVIGLFMKNWEETDPQGACSQEDDFRDVVSVAQQIGIPHYSVNFAKEYQESVFNHFLEDLQKGLTPNPDILCNREIKFKKLLEKAKAVGGGGLATGHYAKINKIDNGPWQLIKPKDRQKDQTYFLYTATQDSLSHTIFPLQNLLKEQVRAIAQHIGLKVHNKKDSTGICFIGERNFRSFIKDWIGTKPGNMVTDTGLVIGKHMGLAFYTIGQRKGLGIGGQADGKGEPWFVAGKKLKSNDLIVVQGENHPLLFNSTLLAKEAHWIGQKPSFPLHCTAKIRYRQADQECVIEENDTELLNVTFQEPQRAITPQQALVLYQGDICLGGGTIT